MSEVIGTIKMYMGENDPEDWLICDGKERNNIDNKYDSLKRFDFGTFINDKYVPPDYSNSKLIYSDNKYNENNINFMNPDVITGSCGRSCHYYIRNFNFINSYNNVIDVDINEDVSPDMKEYINENIDKKQFKSIKHKERKANWIIKYL